MGTSYLHQHPALQNFIKKLGNTTLIEVPSRPGEAKIYAKCEWENPNGSIKDRAAYAMLQSLLESIPQDEWQHIHLLEYSGGNLARSIAHLAHALGLRATLVLSSASGQTLQDDLAALGVETVLVDKTRGFWGVMEETFEIAKRNPEWKFLYQHVNEANLQAHFHSTGAELLKQLPHGWADAWVASVGTGGTVSGVYQRLATVNPRVELHVVTPAELPYGSSEPPNGQPKYAGSGGLGDGRKQVFVERQEEQVTAYWTYSFPETIHEMKRFYDDTGIQIGTSAAANLMAAREVAMRLGPGATVATVFPDAGSPEEWEQANQIEAVMRR